MIPVAALTSMPNDLPAATQIAVAIAAAVIMGAVVALITGRFLRRLLAPVSRTEALDR